MKPDNYISSLALRLASEGVPTRPTMKPPPSFQGNASTAGSAGGGSSVTGDIDNEDDICSGALVRLTNMVGPCIGQTPDANYSIGSAHGDG